MLTTLIILLLTTTSILADTLADATSLESFFSEVTASIDQIATSATNFQEMASNESFCPDTELPHDLYSFDQSRLRVFAESDVDSSRIVGIEILFKDVNGTTWECHGNKFT